MLIICWKEVCYEILDYQSKPLQIETATLPWDELNFL